jgi:hypothetical protein
MAEGAAEGPKISKQSREQSAAICVTYKITAVQRIRRVWDYSPRVGLSARLNDLSSDGLFVTIPEPSGALQSHRNT